MIFKCFKIPEYNYTQLKQSTSRRSKFVKLTEVDTPFLGTLSWKILKIGMTLKQMLCEHSLITKNMSEEIKIQKSKPKTSNICEKVHYHILNDFVENPW